MHKTSMEKAPQRFRGQAVVEFAIVSIMLLMLSFGIVDLGRGVYQRAALTNAVREGARAGSVKHDNATIVAAAQHTSPTLNLSTTNFTSNGGTITCDDWNAVKSLDCTTATTGDRITVCAYYDFYPTARLILNGMRLRMSDCSVMTIQQ